jgi:hypothetical protein
MSERLAKGALFDAFASVAAALGSGRRAEIVDLVAQGERSVEEVASEVGQSVASSNPAPLLRKGPGNGLFAYYARFEARRSFKPARQLTNALETRPLSLRADTQP